MGQQVSRINQNNGWLLENVWRYNTELQDQRIFRYKKLIRLTTESFEDIRFPRRQDLQDSG